ncbi:hypothetical protein HK405_009936, partial [Cladochytrium tenue]
MPPASSPHSGPLPPPQSSATESSKVANRDPSTLSSIGAAGDDGAMEASIAVSQGPTAVEAEAAATADVRPKTGAPRALDPDFVPVPLSRVQFALVFV